MTGAIAASHRPSEPFLLTASACAAGAGLGLWLGWRHQWAVLLFVLVVRLLMNRRPLPIAVAARMTLVAAGLAYFSQLALGGVELGQWTHFGRPRRLFVTDAFDAAMTPADYAQFAARCGQRRAAITARFNGDEAVARCGDSFLNALVLTAPRAAFERARSPAEPGGPNGTSGSSERR